MDMLLTKSLLVIVEALPGDNPPLTILPQPMHASSINPLSPIRGIPLQHIACKDAIPSSVLHVDVDVVALHRDHDVQVNLHAMAYTLLDGEGVGFVAPPPARELGEDEEEGDAEHGDGPFPAAGGLRYILGFCLSCDGVSSCHLIQL